MKNKPAVESLLKRSRYGLCTEKFINFGLCLYILLTLTGCGSGGGSGTEAEIVAAKSSVISAVVISEYQFAGDSGSPSFMVSTLQVPDKDLMGVSVNDSGAVAGNALSGPGTSNGFIWDNDQFTVVIPDGQVSRINASRTVSGWQDVAGGTVACVADEDKLTSMQTGKAYGVNDYGVVAGMQQGVNETKAFINDGQTSEVLLPDFEGYGVLINNSEMIVLHQLLDDTVTPHILEGDQITALPTLDGNYTFARDINEAGDVVGWSESSSGYHAVLWQEGLLYDITPANENHCAAVGINDQSDVVIKCTGEIKNTNYLYRDGITTSIDNLGAQNATVNDINNNGQITGWLYTNQTGHSRLAFLATPI